METIKVLLAEDKESDLMLFKEYLNQSKIVINLDVVKDLKEAVSVIKSDRLFDVFMINLAVSLAEYRKLIIQLKEARPEVAVIFVTKGPDEAEILNKHEIYADYFLNGPNSGLDIIKAFCSAGNFYTNIVKK